MLHLYFKDDLFRMGNFHPNHKVRWCFMYTTEVCLFTHEEKRSRFALAHLHVLLTSGAEHVTLNKNS